MFSVIYNVVFDPVPYRDFQRSVVFEMRDLTSTGDNGGRDHYTILSSSPFASKTMSSKTSWETISWISFTRTEGHTPFPWRLRHHEWF